MDATYQWFTCDGLEIPGETSQNFIPVVTGDYYVVVSNENCTATSTCITVTELGTGEFGRDPFRIYPNPVNDVLNIEYDTILTQVEVFNMIGQRLISKNGSVTSMQIDMSHLPAGTFLIKVLAERTSQTFKIVKK